jgi:hypothetical protein
MGWMTPINPSSNCISSCFEKTKFVYSRYCIIAVDIITYGCLRYWEEAEVFDECAQGNFHFLYGESHADAIAGAHSERHEHVGVWLDFTFRVPSDLFFPSSKD